MKGNDHIGENTHVPLNHDDGRKGIFLFISFDCPLHVTRLCDFHMMIYPSLWGKLWISGSHCFFKEVQWKETNIRLNVGLMYTTCTFCKAPNLRQTRGRYRVPPLKMSNHQDSPRWIFNANKKIHVRYIWKGLSYLSQDIINFGNVVENNYPT